MIHTHGLGRAARYYPDRIAFSDGGRRWTFRELHDRVAGIAGYLACQGFKRGDRIALLLPNDDQYIELIYACAWLGLIAIPLNTRFSAMEIDHALGDATPHGIIRHSSLATPKATLPWQCIIDLQPSTAGKLPPPAPVYDPEAILALIYTSGTTGRSKGVVQTHANILSNIYHLNYWMPYKDRGVYLHAAPIFHILDFPFMFAAPAFGACQATIPKFTPQTFCEAVQREGVTHSVLVPTMINLLIQFDDLKKYDLSSLDQLAYGGSPIAPELVRRTQKTLPNVRLVQGYGLTETGFLTGLQNQEHTDQRLTSCGRTCLGIDLQIVDESGREVAVGQHGELVARGANVTQGYWNNPEETNSAFRNGMFRTGDIGFRDTDGYFFILDRLKDMIVTGGENVYSGEVEAIIYQHPAVREVAVFGIPDPQWGEAVMACVVLKPGQVLSANELIAFCRRSLANYKVPRRIEFLATELPKNGSGKILKRQLREQFWAHEQRAVG
jgi:acyl-CoA synthetase (AMP-forming)/AMP-acid ligase II